MLKGTGRMSFLQTASTGSMNFKINMVGRRHGYSMGKSQLNSHVEINSKSMPMLELHIMDKQTYFWSQVLRVMKNHAAIQNQKGLIH